MPILIVHILELFDYLDIDVACFPKYSDIREVDSIEGCAFYNTVESHVGEQQMENFRQLFLVASGNGKARDRKLPDEGKAYKQMVMDVASGQCGEGRFSWLRRCIGEYRRRVFPERGKGSVTLPELFGMANYKIVDQ